MRVAFGRGLEVCHVLMRAHGSRRIGCCGPGTVDRGAGTAQDKAGAVLDTAAESPTLLLLLPHPKTGKGYAPRVIYLHLHQHQFFDVVTLRFFIYSPEVVAREVSGAQWDIYQELLTTFRVLLDFDLVIGPRSRLYSLSLLRTTLVG